MGRGEKEGWAAIEHSLCPSMLTCPPASRAQSIPSASPQLHPRPAWPEAACHLQWTGPTPWGMPTSAMVFPGQAYLPMGSAPLPSMPWQAPPSIRKYITTLMHTCQPCPPAGSAPLLQRDQASSAYPCEVPHCHGVPWQAPPSHRKCTSNAMRTCQPTYPQEAPRLCCMSRKPNLA